MYGDINRSSLYTDVYIYIHKLLLFTSLYIYTKVLCTVYTYDLKGKTKLFSGFLLQIIALKISNKYDFDFPFNMKLVQKKVTNFGIRIRSHSDKRLLS